MKPEPKHETLVDTGAVENSSLETILEHLPKPSRSEADNPCLVGEVVDARHPTLMGRVLVRCAMPGGERERWLPTLQGLPVRVADRVLLLHPANEGEPIVVGVIDGFARRPQPNRTTAANLELQRDEAVRVIGIDGQDIVEIHQSETGPVVRLLQEDVDLRMPGKLRIQAKAIELAAEQGTVEVTATDDVIVKGEVIHLN